MVCRKKATFKRFLGLPDFLSASENRSHPLKGFKQGEETRDA